MRKTITLIVSMTLLVSLQAKVYYVTPDATAIASKSGIDSWSKPVTLTSAIDLAAADSDEVWIKGGTYFIHRPLSTRKAGITLNSGIKQIYGGFAGTETDKKQRLRSDLDGNGNVSPWEFTNLSILDGSTLEDYSVTYTLKQEIYSTLSTKPDVTGTFLNPTVKCVLSIEGSANHIVDGLVVQNGKFDGDSYAAGINVSVPAIVRNCIVRKCSTTRVENFKGGSSHSSTGSLRAAGPLVVVDGCLVEDNTEGPMMPGCFTSGAVCLSEATFKNSVVRNNISYVRSSAVDGTGFASGELAALGLTAPTTVQLGTGRAAGIYMTGPSAGKKVATVSNCVVANNEIVSYDPIYVSSSSYSNTYGAGITADNRGIIMNCVVVNNKAGYATLNTSTALPTITNEGIGVYLRSSNTNYSTTAFPLATPPVLAYQHNTVVGCYNTISLGNVGTATTSATKADITMKANQAYAPNVAATNVISTTTLAAFSTREVKNCIVGGASINCDQAGSSSVSNVIVGNDYLPATNALSYFSYSTEQKAALLTIPQNIVPSQTAAAVLVNPSSVVGYSATDASIKTANYKLKDDTYASAGIPVSLQWTGYSAGKGPTTTAPTTLVEVPVATVYTYVSSMYDMLGTAYGATPAIGAILNSSSVYSPTAVNVTTADQLVILIKNNLVSTSRIVASIKVYNLNGALVAQGEKTNSVSIAHLPSGVYFAVAGTEKVKFVK
jgi:hypothetical protein